VELWRFVTFCKIAPYINSLTYLLTYLLVSIEKNSQSMNDLDIHPRSSHLLLLNGRMAYHFPFVDCCFNSFIPDHFQELPLLKWTWLPVHWELFHFWQRSLNYKPRALSNLCLNISQLNRALFMRYRYYKGFRQKSDLQTHSMSSAIMPFDNLYMISY